MYSYFAKTVTHEEMIERGPDLETSSLIHWTENILNTIVTITIITIITTTHLVHKLLGNFQANSRCFPKILHS